MESRLTGNESDPVWEKIFSSTQQYRAEILKALLEEEDIPSIIINKQDSAYISIGEIELYVRRDDILPAKRITETFLADE